MSFLTGSVQTSEHPGTNFLTILTLSWLVFTCVFTSSRPVANYLTNASWTLTSAWWRRDDFRFPLVLHLGNAFFPVISNYRSHSTVTGCPTSSWLTVNFFLFFSSLSPSLEIYFSSLSNFNSPYHVTITGFISRVNDDQKFPQNKLLKSLLEFCRKFTDDCNVSDTWFVNYGKLKKKKKKKGTRFKC